MILVAIKMKYRSWRNVEDDLICALSCIGPRIFIFVPAFPLGRVAGPAAIAGLKIPHSQQQSQIVLLAPHQDETKQGWRYNYSTWFMGELLVALPWV